MKKTHLMMMALAAMAVGSVQANEEIAAKKEASCCSLSVEEQAFSSKLSDGKRKLFAMMSAEQRKAVITASVDPALTADAALDKVLKEHHVASPAVEAKAETK